MVHDIIDRLILPFDVDDDARTMILDELKGFAIEHLRDLEQQGVVLPLTATGGSIALRTQLRAAEHPLLQLLADQEFGCAVFTETKAALSEARTLPAWNSAQPALVYYAI